MIKTSLFIGTPDMPEVSYVHLFTDEIEENVARAARLGFDGVELIIGDPDTFEPERLEKALVTYKMELACINSGRMASQFGLSLIHPEENIRMEAYKKFQSLVKIAGRFKCYLNIGIFRGRAIEGKPISHTRDMFVEIMKDACDFAKQYNVSINFEPTNRFEINFINNTDEGLDIVQRVNKPNLGLLLDLYHIYLEDKNMEESIRKSKDIVKHFHFSDSDRWPAGVGNGVIDFKTLVKLLKEINFNGFLSEGLVPTDDADDCAKKTAAFLKKIINEV